MVKDLSRLGTRLCFGGQLHRQYTFPDHDVRFIAVNDGIDSDEGESEIAPFQEHSQRDVCEGYFQEGAFFPPLARKFGRTVISTAVWVYEISRKQKEVDHRPRSRRNRKGNIQNDLRR